MPQFPKLLDLNQIQHGAGDNPGQCRSGQIRQLISKENHDQGDRCCRHQAGELRAGPCGVHGRGARGAGARDQRTGESAGDAGHAIGKEHLVAIRFGVVLSAATAHQQQGLAQGDGNHRHGAGQQAKIVGQRHVWQRQGRQPRRQ